MRSVTREFLLTEQNSKKVAEKGLDNISKAYESLSIRTHNFRRLAGRVIRASVPPSEM
jgi:hypothetical protein